jgi:hypothetical protein
VRDVLQQLLRITSLNATRQPTQALCSLLMVLQLMLFLLNEKNAA